jgi:4-hydroxy-tetrahydrodipicolinate synthase
MDLHGVYIPLVTPFRDGAVDLESLRRIVDRLVPCGIAGLVAGATTGESMALSGEELPAVIATAREAAWGRVPVLAGAGGADTRQAIAAVGRAERAGADGLVSICPYFVRPDQRGILAHFQAVAGATALPVVLYHHPGRTGVRMENDTIRRLAELPNVVGLKDCAGDLHQSMELMLDPPPRFAILTGEDALFYPALALGAAGGILAAAHWRTRSFVALWRAMEANDHAGARALWARLLPGIRLLFAAPSPSPLKLLLHAQGELASREVRLPLLPPPPALEAGLLELAHAAE